MKLYTKVVNTSFWDLTTDIDGDQVNYELYFGNTLETMELVEAVGVNYYEMQNLIEETYFWSVTAYDDLGGSGSSVWSFEVVSATNNAPFHFRYFPKQRRTI